MAFPAFKLEAAFGTLDPFSSAPVWTDISSRLKTVSWSHERQRELDQVSPGQSQIVVDNSDRAFEALNTGSPYYPNVRSDIRVRLSVSIGGGAYQTMFVHYIDDIIGPWGNQSDDLATLQGLDAFSIFELLDLVGLFGQVTQTSTRVTNVLDYIGWPAADRNIIAGGGGLPSQTWVTTDNQGCLAHLQLVADSRPGAIYVAKDGRLTFSAFTTPAGALPSTIGLGGVDFVAAQPRQPRTSCFNVWKLTCSTPAFTSTQQDAISISEHKRRVSTKSVLALTQAQIDACASAFLARYKWPTETFDQIILTPTTDTGYTLLSAVDIGSTGTLIRHSDTGTDYSQGIIVNGYQHAVDIGSARWQVTLRAVARPVT